MLTRLGDRIRKRRHTALLAAIVAAFAVRPVVGDGRTAATVFSLAVLLLMFLALYTTRVDELVGERAGLLRERRWRGVVGGALAVVAVVERVLAAAAPTPGQLAVAAAAWLAFFAFLTGSQLRNLLRQREVTGETISMSISTYLLLALNWGLLYFLIHQHRPDAFQIAGAVPGAADDSLLPTFFYLSLTTISTLGLGDITPLSMPARYAVTAEAIIGQFYLAILVARLVSLQISRPPDAPA